MGRITAPHTSNTIQGKKEREEITNQQEKNTTSSSLHITQHRTFYRLSVQARFLLGPVGYQEPNRDLETDHSISRQKENMEPLRWKMSWRNRATPRPSSPDLYKRDRQLWAVTVKWCVSSDCSWHFSNELAHINRQHPPVNCSKQLREGAAETSQSPERGRGL